MPLKQNEYPQFTYLWYNRQNFRDYERLKRAIESELASLESTRDIVIDLTPCNGLTSTELGVLVRAANRLKGTRRYVRLLTNARVKQTLESTNLDKLEQLVVYVGQKQFIEQVRKTAGDAGGRA
jgi:anti-anti-sigma factor